MTASRAALLASGGIVGGDNRLGLRLGSLGGDIRMILFVFVTVWCTTAAFSADSLTNSSVSANQTNLMNWKWTGILSHAEGQEFHFFVSREQLFRTGYWKPADGNAPLSPGKAEELATTRLKELLKDYKEWELDEINLRHPGNGNGLYWLYQVQYRDRRERLGAPFGILVLFDGSVAPVKITPTK